MIDILRNDILTYPKVFLMSGPIQPDRIPILLRGLPIPEDLRQLWEQFGGGELFESEELLHPTDDFEGIEAATDRECTAEHGLSGFIFHSGYCFSMFLSDQSYVALSRDSFRLLGKFDSLDAWYVSTLRDEFGRRYRIRAGTL